MIRIYFAPMEGVTDAIYRRAHCECFGGVEKYFTPFISPTQHFAFTSREQRDVSPEANAGMRVVPQVLTKNAEQFLHTALMLADAGFGEVNLNLGCPSGTVTAKGKGAGMLRDLGALRAFFDEVFSRAPVKVSVKTRVGVDSVDEWPQLSALYAQYPISELIVHPRTKAEFYRGFAHRELCEVRPAGIPFAYNGDVFTAEDCRAVAQRFPGAAVMIGRGMVANPALAREALGGEGLTLSELGSFHDRLFRTYAANWPKQAVLGRMNEIMSYVLCNFEQPDKIRKAMRKATTLEAYEAAASALFSGGHGGPGPQPFAAALK